MLTVPGQKIPRKISVKVIKAEKLKETKKEGKNKVNNKFKVIVLGGKSKESSNTVIGSDGNVEWNYSCTIKLHKTQNDPLVLLVEDSDGHHKGQVVIPIVKIPSKSTNHSANNNMLYSELEPTQKCSASSGFLTYCVLVEEYYTEEQLTSGKKSFNKSMSSLFGSKSKLSSSKTNLEIPNTDSISNFGSHSNLNKPEKHKKSSSFLNLKIGGKKKKLKPPSDVRITPDSSDMDTLSNFSFNPTNSVNPFENDSYLMKNDRMSIKNSSLADEDNNNLAKASKRYTNDSYHSTKQNIPNNGNHDNFSESQFSIKSGDSNNPFSNGMVPNIMPPSINQNALSSDNTTNFKQHNSSVVSSTLPNKYNTMKDLSNHKELPINNEPISSISSQNEIESTYRPGHNKSTLGSDYSIFSQYSNQLPLQLNNKGCIDESENIKKENTELKLLNSRLGQQINDLTNELDSVKETLCKLRLKLLYEGATKYLEI